MPVARWVDSNVVPELQSLVGLDSHAGFDPISIKVVSTSVNTTIKQTDSKMKLIKNTGDSCTVPEVHERGLIHLAAVFHGSSYCP